jgi:cytochrome P450
MTPHFFNPADPAFNADPYLHYRRLREADPIHRSPLGAWFLSRYNDVREALTDTRFRVRDIPGQIQRKGTILAARSGRQSSSLEALERNARHWLSFIERPDHTRIRQLVGKAFRNPAVEQLRDFVRECASELIASARSRGRMELMSDFSRPLPTRVIGKLLGVPQEDLAKLTELTERVSRILDPLLPLEEYQQLEPCAAAFAQYWQKCIDERRSRPAADLITALIQAQEEDSALTDDELISICTLVFAAGSETTVNLIGNGTLALLRNPERLEQLRREPQVIPQAVEELLRFDPPLQMTSRSAMVDVSIEGKTIRKGDQVYLLVGSANRDPAEFDRPNELVFGRPRNHHLSFAAGHHHCLGATLARIEGQEAISALVSMLPDLRLEDAEIKWRSHIVLRGLAELRVRFSASPRSSVATH